MVPDINGVVTVRRIGRNGHPQIPEHLDPALQFILRAILERDPDDLTRTWWRVEAGAGLGKDTLRCWLYHHRRDTVRARRGPPIDYVRRALNVLGHDLAIVSLPVSQPDTMPPALERIAA